MAIGLAGLAAVSAAASNSYPSSGPLEIRIFGANGDVRDFLARSAEDRRGALALVNQIAGAIQGQAQPIEEAAVMLPHYRIGVSHLGLTYLTTPWARGSETSLIYLPGGQGASFLVVEFGQGRAALDQRWILPDPEVTALLQRHVQGLVPIGLQPASRITATAPWTVLGVLLLAGISLRLFDDRRRWGVRGRKGAPERGRTGAPEGRRPVGTILNSPAGYRVLVGRLGGDLGAHRVIATVDVHDLPGGGRAVVRKQDGCHLRDRRAILAVPAERGALAPGVFEALESRDPFCRHRLQGPSRQRVHANVVLAEVPSEVARDRFERGFAHAHPVVEGPRLGGIVEVERDDTAALRHQRAERLGHRLERIGAGLERGLHTLPWGGHEIAAKRVGGGEGDRVDEAVEAAPALLQRAGQRAEVLLIIDVHLEDVGGRCHPAGTLLGQAHDAAEAGEHDIGALLLSRLGNRKRDAGWGEDAGDEDLLPLEDARHGGPILSEPAGRGLAH